MVFKNQISIVLGKEAQIMAESSIKVKKRIPSSKRRQRKFKQRQRKFKHRQRKLEPKIKARTRIEA
jgi:hypothetical protein